jgi:hypothetical protein
MSSLPEIERRHYQQSLAHATDYENHELHVDIELYETIQTDTGVKEAIDPMDERPSLEFTIDELSDKALGELCGVVSIATGAAPYMCARCSAQRAEFKRRVERLHELPSPKAPPAEEEEDD